jgi:hypothetical protein
MIADRACFVHDLRMKSVRLVSMLVRSHSGCRFPRHARNVEWFEKHETNLGLLLLVLALPASAADRSEEVRATEIAFAKAFADRDAKTFFVTRRRRSVSWTAHTMRGKQEVIAGWSDFFKPIVAPFRW